MKKTAKLVSILLTMAMLLGLLGACTGDKPKAETKPPETAPGTETKAPVDDKPVEKQYLRISAGPSGGFIYTMFAGISDLVNKDFPGYYDIQVDISTGTSENARNIMMGEAQLSMVGLDVIKDAYDATGEFEGMESGQITHVMSGPPAIVHIMVPADSKVEKIEDLVGKKVGVGKGVMSTYLPMLFEALGQPADTTEMTQLTITDMCNGLADGTIAAGIYATPYPTSAISDLSLTSGMKLIPIPADVVAKVAETAPYFYVENIPATAYNGLTQDTPTMARRSAIVAGPDVDPEVVYNFVKTIVDHNEELAQVHADCATLNLDNALSGLQIPLHPGAEQYYKEVGLVD